MRLLIALSMSMALIAAACGGGATPTGDSTGGTASQGPRATATTAGGQTSDVEQEPAGAVEPNTIRIGSTVFKRTLPMTTGQCYLFKDDGTLPTNANVWGTVDGDETSHFAAKLTQKGTFEADVKNNAGVNWAAGALSPEVDDLVIEIDFDTQTIKGHGTFYSIIERRSARGSFEFICEA